MSVAATRFAHAEGRVCLAYKSDGEKVGEEGGERREGREGKVEREI